MRIGQDVPSVLSQLMDQRIDVLNRQVDNASGKSISALFYSAHEALKLLRT
jgi:hypothetical protein